jgi:membrane protease YdiL (CAAX protease family)
VAGNGGPSQPGPWGDMAWPGSPEVALGPSSPGPTSNGHGNGRATKRPVQRIPARAALVALPGAAAGIVLAGIGAAIGQAITGSSTSALSDLLGEAGLWAAMLLTVLYVSRRFGTASLQRDFGLAVKPKDPIWGVCAAISAFLAAGLVLLVFSGSKFSGSNDQILTQQKGHEAGIVIVTLIVALGAPFFEELFFRGFLRTALQARFGRHGAVWLQAVFFGLAHAGEAGTALGNVSVVLAMFSVGVILGYTAMLTGRLGAGMIAHCLFNLIAVASVV